MLKPGIYNRYDIPLFCSFNSIKVMKRIFLLPLTAAAVWCAMPVHADEPVETDSMTPDSMKLYELQQIEVTATRVDRKTPVAYADIGREAISRRNFGSDMPTLLQMTPSVVATSDAGNGIGGTAFRLRGSDASRINVTTNGVPMNDAESHSVYWYDTPDMASSVGTIQVQRGAGTSTNGTGAFGGSVNMTTAPMSSEFSGEASLSYGSYNTNKQSLQIGSGLMGGHWTSMPGFRISPRTVMSIGPSPTWSPTCCRSGTTMGVRP